MDLLGIGALLESILCVLKNFAYLFLSAGCILINLVIKAFGLFAAALILLLPDMPAPLQAPDNDILGALNWLFPVSAFLAIFLTFLICYAIFLAIRVALRWVKQI